MWRRIAVARVERSETRDGPYRFPRISLRSIRATNRASLYDLRHHAGADGAAALADGEAKLLLHRDRHDQLDRHRHVVARHHHLGAVGQLAHPGHVRGPEVELRTVVGEERRVTPALV